MIVVWYLLGRYRWYSVPLPRPGCRTLGYQRGQIYLAIHRSCRGSRSKHCSHVTFPQQQKSEILIWWWFVYASSTYAEEVVLFIYGCGGQELIYFGYRFVVDINRRTANLPRNVAIRLLEGVTGRHVEQHWLGRCRCLDGGRICGEGRLR